MVGKEAAEGVGLLAVTYSEMEEAIDDVCER